MNQYIENVLNDKKQTDERIRKTLRTIGIMPDMNNPAKNINLIEEMILKIIYLHKVFFLEEMVELFTFSYGKQQIEEIMIKLEKKKYITCKIDREFGKCFCLTKNSLFYIKYNPIYMKGNIIEVQINDDKFPSESLIKYKILSKLTSNYVFSVMTNYLYDEFKNISKKERREYSRLQFLKHFLYKDYLEKKENERIDILNELKITEEETSKFLSVNKYSEELAQIFAEKNINFFGYEKLDNDMEYRKYRACILHYCLKKETKSKKMTFAFLKDFISEKNKKDVLQEILNIILSISNNYMRGENKELLYSFYHEHKNEVYKNQYLLYMILEKQKILKINHQKLLHSDTNKSFDELKEINFNIEELRKYIKSESDKIKILGTNFQFPVYEKIEANGLVRFKEQNITLSSLSERSVFISHIGKGQHKNIIEFAIIQTRSQGFTFDNLFSKIESCFILWWHIFNTNSYEFRITIYTEGENRKQDIIQIMDNLKNRFEQIPEYKILSSLFYDVIFVKDCKTINYERYEVYNFIKEQMENLS
ncbi:PHP domain-containing protein [Lacrimispora brassicae]